jgi:hypothetical protein
MCISAVVSSAVASKYEIEEEDPMIIKNAKKLRSPQVEQERGRCIFENDDDHWCFSSTPPMLEVGWEHNQ